MLTPETLWKKWAIELKASAWKSNALKEGFIHTTIADQGVGIPEYELNGIFEPFKKSSARPTGGETISLDAYLCHYSFNNEP